MSPRLRIRPALPQERQALEALQWRASLTSDEDRPHLLANPDVIHVPPAEIEAGCVLVAEADGAVAGFAVVLAREDGEAELDGLFVDPQTWRRGVGRRLVQAAAALAVERGANVLHVIANPAALDFYRATGFEAYGDAKVQFGRAVLMRRAIP